VSQQVIQDGSAPRDLQLRIFPVLDLMGGLVVHGRGGRRDEYRPIESALCSSPEPQAVATAFRERFGLDHLYVADLDAIAGAPASTATFRLLKESGFELLVDAGARSADEARRLLDAGVAGVIAPLETLPGPAALHDTLAAVGAARLIFSLDLKDGVPIGELEPWGVTDPAALAHRAIECGVERILVLDLSRVGSAEGPAHLKLLAGLRRDCPKLEILSGGGVRSHADLASLEAAGVNGALVATALHDGSLNLDG
jgi:phosphoribosylformimino-5-aminoimidazole carboxamide ribotide isomerase